MVCLTLLGAEYLLGYNGTDFGKDEIRLPAGFWDISKEYLTSLDSFAEKLCRKGFGKTFGNIPENDG